MLTVREAEPAAPPPAPRDATASARRVPAALAFLAAASVPAAVVLSAGRGGMGQSLRVLLAVTALVSAGAAVATLVSGTAGVAAGLKGFRLGTWWVVYFTLVFGVGSVAWLSQQGGSSALIPQAAVPLAVLLCLAALICWTVGYLIGPPAFLSRWLARVVSWAAPPAAGPDRPEAGIRWALRTPRIALVIYGIGVLARVAQIATGRFAYLADPRAAVGSPSSLNQIFALVGQSCRFALIVAMVDFVLRRSTRTKVTLAVILVAELGFGLLAGMKSELLLTLLALALVYGVAHRRLSRKVIIAGVVGMCVIVPLNAQYREQVRTESGVISSGDAARLLPGLLGRTLAPGNIPDLVTSAPEALAGRLRHIDSVALIMEKTPSAIPHAGTRELVTAPVYGLVPRAIWQSKPALLSTYRFNQDYRNLPATVYSSSALTFPGDLYRHGGPLAVVVGMALLGVACRLVETRFYPRDDLRLVLLYIPFFVLFGNAETDAVSVISSVVQTFVVALVVTKLAFTIQRR